MNEKQMKINQLVDEFGFSSSEEMMESYVMDSVAPAICMNVDCDYTTEYEPDQDAGWCEECGSGTVKSIFILEGII